MGKKERKKGTLASGRQQRTRRKWIYQGDESSLFLPKSLKLLINLEQFSYKEFLEQNFIGKSLHTITKYCPAGLRNLIPFFTKSPLK